MYRFILLQKLRCKFIVKNIYKRQILSWMGIKRRILGMIILASTHALDLCYFHADFYENEFASPLLQQSAYMHICMNYRYAPFENI